MYRTGNDEGVDMLVMIEKIFPPKEKELYSVEFFYTIRSTIHSAKYVRDSQDSQNLIGKWVGGTPQINKWYNVEISVENELLWGRDVVQLEYSEPSIKSPVAGINVLQGPLDATKDGFITLRIGDSHLILNIIGIPIPFAGDVSIRATGIRLYDMDVTDVIRYGIK